MSTTTLYFGKINYNSEIHKIHSKELDLKTINKKILSYFVSGIKYEETIILKNVEKEYSREYEYELFRVEVYNNSIILGNISKNISGSYFYFLSNYNFIYFWLQSLEILLVYLCLI